ncbi:hypothetical protein [Kitasatospora sp. NPDC004531]
MPTNARWKKTLATAGIALAALTMSATALTGQASAAGATDGQAGLTGAYCIESPGVTTCFEAYGDKVRVYDSAKDGYSAVGLWTTDCGRDGGCRNANGYGTWAECNYDMRETGHIRLQNALYDGDTGRMVPIDKFSPWLAIG